MCQTHILLTRQGEEYSERLENARSLASANERATLSPKPTLMTKWTGGVRAPLVERLSYDAERRQRLSQRMAEEEKRRQEAEMTCKPKLTRRGHSAPPRGVSALHTFD